jgi:hypothetical protein
MEQDPSKRKTFSIEHFAIVLSQPNLSPTTANCIPRESNVPHSQDQGLLLFAKDIRNQKPILVYDA